MDVEFDDADFDKFTNQAREAFRSSLLKFGEELAEEADRIEAGRSHAVTPHEVTASVVEDANVVLRRGLRPKRRSAKVLAARLLAAALPLLVGISYSAERLQDPFYMAFFVVLIVGALLAVTFSVIWD